MMLPVILALSRLLPPLAAMDMVTILSKIPDLPLEPYDEVKYQISNKSNKFNIT